MKARIKHVFQMAFGDAIPKKKEYLDSLKLDDLKLKDWTKYEFWDALPEGYKLPVPLPKKYAGYNTYTSPGLPPGPIDSPSLLALQAAFAQVCNALAEVVQHPQIAARGMLTQVRTPCGTPLQVSGNPLRAARSRDAGTRARAAPWPWPRPRPCRTSP